MNKVSIGSWITLNNMSVVEVMADAAFDWLCIDMEHTVIDYTEAQHLIATIQSKNLVSYVRVGENNSRIIKRVLDAGADGIIVPLVNSQRDAENAVKAVKYPPIGDRGVGAVGRAQNYGFGFEEYAKTVNQNTKVMAQIEHIDAINNLEAILSVQGIDGTIIGPYDLSGSMDKPGEFDDKEVEEAIHTVLEAGKKYNIPAGFHSVPSDWNEANKYRDQGFKILGFSVDSIFLGDAASSAMGKLKRDE